jgi:ketosteroid isomerase-like protein
MPHPAVNPCARLRVRPCKCQARRVTTLADVDRQEALFARAFAAGDPALAHPLYEPDVVYLSPTVRLFDWPRRIEGVERALEFIALTIARCRDIDYRCVERAVLPGADAAYARIHFDWTTDGRRLRSSYVVVYRYRNGRIAQQELYYDPSAPPEVLSA